MPIKIPDNLPAFSALRAEGVITTRESDAIRQDIRPLRIGLLNLMPNKIRTETQIARLLGATPLQVDLPLVKIKNHVPRNTSNGHMISFYRPWEEIRSEKFDGFIITGAPLERMPFEEVSYWDELCHFFEWTQSNVHSCFHICWAAQAAIYHFHRVPKDQLSEKAFGIYQHRNLAPTSPYVRGFSDNFPIPVSRWTEVRRESIPVSKGITVLMESPEVGLCLLEDAAHRCLYMFNHIEYDSDSLSEEYFRDRVNGTSIVLPHDYFPMDNPSLRPENNWRSHAHLLFSNWLNEIYQTAPFDISCIGNISQGLHTEAKVE